MMYTPISKLISATDYMNLLKLCGRTYAKEKGLLLLSPSNADIIWTTSNHIVASTFKPLETKNSKNVGQSVTCA